MSGNENGAWDIPRRAKSCAHLLWARPTGEVTVLVAIGLIVGTLGPYGTNALPPPTRHLYWLCCIVAGGLLGIAVDQALGRKIAKPQARVVLTALLMTPAVTLFVLAANHLVLGDRADPRAYLALLWPVFAVSLPVMAVRALAWRRATPVLQVRTLVETRTVIETRTVVEPPLPTATEAFRRRLSAPRRGARLIAVGAHDHYLKVHTDAGEELVTMRFADALAELAQAHGYRVHRSWWVAAEAIVHVDWRRGTGEAQLEGGLRVPISRSCAPTLKQAGW